MKHGCHSCVVCVRARLMVVSVARRWPFLFEGALEQACSGNSPLTNAALKLEGQEVQIVRDTEDAIAVMQGV